MCISVQVAAAAANPGECIRCWHECTAAWSRATVAVLLAVRRDAGVTGTFQQLKIVAGTRLQGNVVHFFHHWPL